MHNQPPAIQKFRDNPVISSPTLASEYGSRFAARNQDVFIAIEYSHESLNRFLVETLQYGGRELFEQLVFDVFRGNGFDYLIDIEKNLVVFRYPSEWSAS